jgi:hypothetical protein
MTTGKEMVIQGPDHHKAKAVDGLVTVKDIQKLPNGDGKTGEAEEAVLPGMMMTEEEIVHPDPDQARVKAVDGLETAKGIPKRQNVDGKNAAEEAVLPEMKIVVVTQEMKIEEAVVQGPDHPMAMAEAGLETVKDIQMLQNVVGVTDKSE